MTTYVKYWLFRVLNFTFRLIIPAVIAGVVFGLFKAPTDVADVTWLQRAEMGMFVIILLAVFELKDYLGKLFKQFGIDNQVSFMRNRGVIFILIGLILLAVKMFADKAIDFFLLAGLSQVVAYFFEHQANKYFRILHPSSTDKTMHKLDMLMEQLESDNNNG
jgi:type III secretory pathway component EscS